jgi:hypothetical protein
MVDAYSVLLWIFRTRSRDIQDEIAQIRGKRAREKDEALQQVKERIRALAEMAANPLRDVWRFTSPLKAGWNRLNPLRNNPKFQHWGVVVADMGKDVVEGVMKHRKEFKKEKRGRGMGFIHELSRVGRQSAYRVYKWMSNAVKAGCQLMCVGKTRLKDDEILVKGIEHFMVSLTPRAFDY